VTPNQSDKLKLLRESELRQILGLSHSCIWRLIKAGVFPAGVRVGVRSLRWPLRDVENWLKTREGK